MSKLNQEKLKSILDYSPDSGLFRWKMNIGSRAKQGAIAGNMNDVTGYCMITIDKKPLLAHRLAFLYMTGSFPLLDVDHISGERSDNSWLNLRDVSKVENHRNRRMHKSNTSGVTGVRWMKLPQKWVAEIRYDYKLRHLGLFSDKFDAICARKKAEVELGFHYNHGTGVQAKRFNLSLIKVRKKVIYGN